MSEIQLQLMADLMRDYGLAPHQAAGVVGNLAHESGNFGTLQEIAPLVPGSRGGYGYAQWTGPRRRAFESWVGEQGLDPTSYEANYGFLRHELDNTPEGRVLGSLRDAGDVQSATSIFERQFLRPGIPHSESRLKRANAALAGFPGAGEQSSRLASVGGNAGSPSDVSGTRLAGGSPRVMPTMPQPNEPRPWPKMPGGQPSAVASASPAAQLRSGLGAMMAALGGMGEQAPPPQIAPMPQMAPAPKLSDMIAAMTAMQMGS